MATAPQQFCVRWNSYHTNLQTVFPRLLLTEQFADVTLACESRQLRCHKLVLSACSAYLERLLVQNPCKHPIVLMKDMRFSEMQALVDFMYKGEVNVTQEELPSLLKSAEALQIRGLCSSDTNGLSDLIKPQDSKQFAAATDALVANAHKDSASHNGQGQQSMPQTSHKSSSKKRKCSEPRPEIKEEAVEEDGLYYGDLDHHTVEYNEDDDSEKPGSSLGQTSGINPYVRVKPESELLFQTKLQNFAKTNTDYLQRLTHMSPQDIRKEFTKYGLNTDEIPSKSDNDYYKSWLEQNGELEVSLLRANEKKRQRDLKVERNEVDLITKSKVKPLEAMRSEFLQKTNIPYEYQAPIRRRGRPPIFKEKAELNETVLKSDLDQFLEGKEVSSSGLSRKDLERIMMGKFNPNRRYSNEAMWAALMDVKKGGSIYRAAQTHKVPRKSLRNWMKRCHIKSSFPMPQQLKQFVENSKRQKEYKNYDQINLETPNVESIDELQTLDNHDIDFGKHFLTYDSNQVSSDDDVVAELPSNHDVVTALPSNHDVVTALPSNEQGKQDGVDENGGKKNDSALDMSLHE